MNVDLENSEQFISTNHQSPTREGEAVQDISIVYGRTLNFILGTKKGFG